MSFQPLEGLLGRISGGGIFGQPQNPGGLLGAAALQDAQKRSQLAMAAALLQASGPSPQKIGFGQALGGAMMVGQQAGDQANQQSLQAELLKRQIQKASAPIEVGPGNSLYDPEKRQTIYTAPPADKSANLPNSAREYEYAVGNGFKGSFQDWISAGGQSSRPSAITVYEYFKNLPAAEQKAMLETMRAPMVRDVGGVPTIVTGQGGLNPLSTLQQEISALTAKARGEKIGAGQGEIETGIQKKGAAATSMTDTLDIADQIIDKATGSYVGAAKDKAAEFIGVGTQGAEAIAQLKVLQANLMTNMPRMEGPQSDRDVQLYREAAGQIGDPTVPRNLKKAALKSIRELQRKYQQRANVGLTQGQGFAIHPNSSPQAAEVDTASDPLGIRR